MKKVFLALPFVLLGYYAAWGTGEHENLLPQAAELYPRRYELPVLERIISIYEETLEEKENDAEILSRLAQFWCERAMLVPEEEKKACLERARDYALAALRADPGFSELERKESLVAAIKASGDVASLLWYATAQGQLLGMINPFSAFKLLKPVRAAYERVVELEETFWGCSALHALGAIEANIAADFWARLFLEGSFERAEEYFERAISLCPDYLINYQEYAANYAVLRNDKALFRSLIQKVLEGPIGDWPFWNRVAKMDAEVLIREHPELWEGE